MSSVDACPVACGGCDSEAACADSTSWYWKKSKYDCDYIAKKSKRCKSKYADEYDVSNYVEFKFEAKSEEKHKAIAAKEDFYAQLPEAEQAVLVRMATDRYVGRTPLHCHGLDHGDIGLV